jgi:hypothetical protein
MGTERNGLMRGRLGWGVALTGPMLLLSAHAQAGIAPVGGATSQQSNVFAKTLITHAEENSATADMYLPDPAQNSAVSEPAVPEITIPQLPSEAATSGTSNKEGVNAIPLPPAFQSGLTGLVALGMAGGLRRLRRVFR